MRLFEIKSDAYSDEHIYNEKHLRYKAGAIPWMHTDEGIKMLFVTSSNPKFGGIHPAIAKGGADDGEKPKQTALRELEEEIGIKRAQIKNTKLITTEMQTGIVSTYKFHVYACEVNSAKFKIDDDEIARADWMTYAEFMEKGRPSHKSIVTQFIKSKI